MSSPSRAGLVVVALVTLLGSLADAAYRAGVASVDVTPDYPVRLSGFGFRRAESEGVTHRIYAKALAIDDGVNGPAVVLCVDNLAIPLSMTREVAGRLEAKLTRERLAVTCTHTHTAPMLTNVAPTLFGQPIPPEHQANIDRYTKELADALEKAASAAIADLKPARLEFAIGTVDFAMNRRTKGGPVDHDLPVLVVRDAGDNSIRGIYLNYACHCVTLSDNKVSGDWAGFAQAAIQTNHPGAVALVSVGCGADSNPKSGVTGDKKDVAAGQGEQIAAEVRRLLKHPMKPVDGPLTAAWKELALPFDTHPTRDEWEKRAKRVDAVGYHARVNLAKLDRGEKLQTEVVYPVQTWAFGEQLAMVFLPGEVVVDYSLRLKKELDRARLWVNGYSNDVPGYIPSERILKEGRYEGGDAMVYYDRPTKFAQGLEQKIVDEVRRQLPTFVAPKGVEGVAPKSPQAALEALRTKPGLTIELVASEPLINSPVAIDWSADGRLWVCEMFDYPTGVDGKWKPAGRVKVLEDADGDGRYEKATTFLEGLPFPTGITAWGDGVFVCAAPDVLFARDADGDGRGDHVEKVFSGFASDNYQARVNSISLGLDNWLYAANGLLGGVITGRDAKLDIRGRDFRFRPMRGPIETVTGLTQQGRVRDDFGRWFGCDNSNALFYYPHEQRYLSRNPHVPQPPATIRPKGDYDVSRVYPISRTLERFNDPANVNRFTSGCGLGIYRDTVLGPEYEGNAFTCEPVHNLVHRMILDGEGQSLSRRRAPGEAAGEFLASTDNWFRPVQVRTGPDGALYVVDMYRFVIEHPRWIPPDRLKELDARAGAGMGRIFRIRPSNGSPRPIRNLTALDDASLAAALDTPSGTERDRVHAALLVRGGVGAIPTVEKLSRTAILPQVRVQALAVLDGLSALRPNFVLAALQDADPRVRIHALRLAETYVTDPAPLLPLADDADARVRRQLAFTLGQYKSEECGRTLVRLAKRHPADADLRVAILSSAVPHAGVLIDELADDAAWLQPLIATVAGSKDERLIDRIMAKALPPADGPLSPGHLASLATMLESLNRVNAATHHHDRLAPHLSAVRRLAADAASPHRAAALRVLAHAPADAADLDFLCPLAASADAHLRGAAILALRRHDSPEVPKRLLAEWPKLSPAARRGVLPLLLSREPWAAAVVAAVKDQRVHPSEIPPADRKRILPASETTGRPQALAKFASVAALKGDVAAGRELFVANCAACHALGGVGHALGPDLAPLRSKGADYLVRNILDPNAAVEPRFVAYDLTLNDARSTTGLITAETEVALTLSQANGLSESIPRADVRSIKASALSLMPEGLESALSPQQMADLIAFIKAE